MLELLLEDLVEVIDLEACHFVKVVNEGLAL